MVARRSCRQTSVDDSAARKNSDQRRLRYELHNVEEEFPAAILQQAVDSVQVGERVDDKANVVDVGDLHRFFDNERQRVNLKALIAGLDRIEKRRTRLLQSGEGWTASVQSSGSPRRRRVCWAKRA